MTAPNILRLATASLFALACSDSTSTTYDPVIPTDWVGSVDNSYFPLAPGTIWQYAAQTADGLETTRVEVLATQVMINGVAATTVLDQVSLDGSLVEETHDWYAQDGDGNVWYLGEDSKEYENGQVTSTAGSWTWGVDGALPGVLMWADPAGHVGIEYRQEFSKGVAEDWGKITDLGRSVTVPAGSYTGCVTTEDWDGSKPFEPREHKAYCPGVGIVRSVDVGAEAQPEELTSVTRP
jgi:hypothetical protein